MANSLPQSEIRKKDFYVIKSQQTGDVLRVIFPNGIQVGLDSGAFNKGIKLTNQNTAPEDTSNALYVLSGVLYFDGSPISGGGGGGAPTDAQYLTLALNGTLTQERLLVAGNGLTLTDGGAGGNATLAVGAGSYITVAADTVAVNLSTLTPAIAGDGLTGTGSTLAVGAGDGISVAANSVAVLPEPTSGTIAASSTGTSVIVEATNLILALQIFS